MHSIQFPLGIKQFFLTLILYVCAISSKLNKKITMHKIRVVLHIDVK